MPPLNESKKSILINTSSSSSTPSKQSSRVKIIANEDQPLLSQPPPSIAAVYGSSLTTPSSSRRQKNTSFDDKKHEEVHHNISTEVAECLRILGQDLSCSICLGLLTDPHSLPCTHYFCKACLERSIMFKPKSKGDHSDERTNGSSTGNASLAISLSTSSKCPLCKAPFIKRSATTAHALNTLALGYKQLIEAFERDTESKWDEVEDQLLKQLARTSHPVDQLSQLYPYPQKNNKGNITQGGVTKDSKEEEHQSTTDVTDDGETEEASSTKDVIWQIPNKKPEAALGNKIHTDVPTPSHIKPMLLRSVVIERRKPMCITTSGLSRDQLITVKEWSATFDIPMTDYLIEDVVDENRKAERFDGKDVPRKSEISEVLSTTHLIVNDSAGGVKRTLKVCKAILKGLWIISFDWIEECLKRAEMCTPDQFEVRGIIDGFLESGAPHRSRLSRQNHEPGLFSGLFFYFYEGDRSDRYLLGKEPVVQLITDGDGLVLQDLSTLVDNRKQNQHSNNSRRLRQKNDSKMIILCDPSETKFERDAEVLKCYRPFISTTWLLDSISALQLLPRHPYILLPQSMNNDPIE